MHELLYATEYWYGDSWDPSVQLPIIWEHIEKLTIDLILQNLAAKLVCLSMNVILPSENAGGGRHRFCALSQKTSTAIFSMVCLTKNKVTYFELPGRNRVSREK